MTSLAFWKSWTPVNQRLFWLFTALAALSFCFLWTSEYRAPSPVIDAQLAQEIIPTSFESHAFRLGIFILSVPADALLVFERTEGAPLKPNAPGSFIFLAFLVSGLVGMITIITTLPRFWFLTGLGFFILVIVSLRLEAVLLFGIPNLLTGAGVTILFLIPSAYFGLSQNSVSFTRRLLVFALVAATIGLLINSFARVPHPFLCIAANGIVAATIIMIVFIFMVAHEPLAGLIGAISRGTRQTKSLVHFMAIGTIWLINLGIIYANRKHIIQWDYLPINIIVFISLSGILGLWGFRQRDSQFDGIIKSNPFGVLLYLCIATIGFGTIGFFFATANDPVIRFAEDAILFSSLGYGIIFMIYVINNFGAMLSKNLQVYKVLYQPENMPYFTFRLAGLICTVVFFAYSNWKVSMHQVYAGYYNLWGDNYIAADTLNLAEGYYNRAQFYALRNYHAHYALAQINDAKGDIEKEIKEYHLLADSRPLDLAYLNLSRLAKAQNSLHSSIDILRVGLHDFPKNGRLQNELGLDFAALNQKDSALILVKSAMKSSLVKSEAAVNYMGLQAQFKSSAPADSLLLATGSDNPGVRSNALALACIQGTSMSLPADPGKDTVLVVYQVTTLHNILINQKDHPDTALISKTVWLAHKNENPYVRDFLISGAAFARYANGENGAAINLLHEAAFAGQEEKYFNALGLWCLEQNVPGNAVLYFDRALKEKFKPALFNKAIALTEAHRFPEAISVWDSLRHSSDSSERKTAATLLNILTVKDTENSSVLTDEGKSLFARYRIDATNTEEFERLINEISDPNLKVATLIDRSKLLDEAAEPDFAYAVLDAVKGLPVRDKTIYQEILHLNLLFLAQQKKWKEIEVAMKDKTLFQGRYKTIKVYLEALLASQAGNKAVAVRDFKWLLSADPFLEDAIVSSIQYLGADDPKSLTLYSALVSALDLNPQSVKLLKLHAVLSLRLDFHEAGQTSLDQLKKALSRQAFLDFLKEYPDLFEVQSN